MSTGNTPTPKAPIPWVWVIATVFATTCLVCPCGTGAGWWLGSGRGPAVQIPGGGPVVQIPGTGSVPTEEMARKVIEKRNQNDLAKGYVRLVSVRKTDATDGGKVLHCDAEFEFLKNWKFQDTEGWPFRDYPNEFGALGHPGHMKGEKITIKAKVEFEKSEKGWRSEGVVY